MGLRRSRRDAQPFADLVVGESRRDQLDDFALPLCDVRRPLAQYVCHVAEANSGVAS